MPSRKPPHMYLVRQKTCRLSEPRVYAKSPPADAPLSSVKFLSFSACRATAVWGLMFCCQLKIYAAQWAVRNISFGAVLFDALPLFSFALELSL